MKWRGEQATAALRRGALRGLKAWADDVFKESQRLVPVDTKDPRGGRLKESGKVEVDAGKLKAVISYKGEHRKADGKSSGPTAIFVHEIMTVKHDGIQQAKYLEQPLMASRRSGPARVRAEIRREL